MRSLNHWIVMTLFGVLWLGCNDDASDEFSQPCRVNSECPIPEICFGADETMDTLGQCVLECRIDTDCPSDSLCIENVCARQDRNCRTTEDCTPFGRVCDPGTRTCVMPCGLGDTCPSGGECINGRCPPSGDGQTGGTRRNDAAPSGGGPRPMRDAMPRVQDASSDRPVDARVPEERPLPVQDAAVPPQDMSVVRGAGTHGDPCRCGSDCMSGLCLPNPYNQFAGQCTSECGGGAGCPGVERCIAVTVPEPGNNCPPAGLNHAVGSQINVCAPNETGIPCQQPRDCVIDGVCLTPPNPIPGQVNVQPICAAQCQGDGQCPNGYRCSPVPTGDGGQINVCNPTAQLTSCPDGSNGTCGGVCNAGPGDDPLFISHCIVLGANQPGYCSCSCNSSAQCPAGFACSRGIIDTEDPLRPGICLPIGGYNCPTGGDSCLTLACAPQLEAEQFPRCTAPCETPQDCPSGYQCIGIPGEDRTYCIAELPEN